MKTIILNDMIESSKYKDGICVNLPLSYDNLSLIHYELLLIDQSIIDRFDDILVMNK